MAFLTEESSATLLPARQVFIKTKNSSQALRTGLAMPAYTIQRNAPWMASEGSRDSMSSDEEDGHRTPAPAKVDRPLHPTPRPAYLYHPSEHAHPQHQMLDHGPQGRQSRLPIFKQVRNILHKPHATTGGQSKYDDPPGDVSEQARLGQRSTPKLYEGVFNISRSRLPERRPKSPSKSQKQRAKRDLSPVSILHDDEIKPVVPLKAGTCSPALASPVSSVSPLSSRPPTALSANERPPQPTAVQPTAGHLKQFKRKPTPSSILSSSQTENRAPSRGDQRSVSGKSDWTELPLHDWEMEQSQQLRVPRSHFSWSTHTGSAAAPSVNKSPKSPSCDEQEPDKSHSSSSTVNTSFTFAGGHAESEPLSPVPAIPAKYASQKQEEQPYQAPQGAAYQSIVSRPRPVPRPEETYTPPRKSSMPLPSTSHVTTPSSAYIGKNSGLHPTVRSASPLSSSPSPTIASTASGTKSLPPPPMPEGPQSRIEKLEAEEQNLKLRRRNAEKAIADLAKVEKANPLEVSFAAVREAKERLKEHQENLADLLRQEREVGIGISRARRKEGMEEGLWVRRVVS